MNPEVPVGPTPEVSVIVGAYRRSEFVERAIDSVLAQRLERSRFEVVVLTDLDAPDLVERYGARGVAFVRSGEPRIGRWLLAAIDRTRAPWIAFLDDDDEFEPDRLASALDVLRSEPGTIFYRNRVRPIDRDDRPIPGPRWRTLDRDPAFDRTGPVRVPTGDRRALAPFLVEDATTSFNSSTMIVGRALFEGPLREAFAATQLPDLALFALSILVPGGLYLDDRRLTRYRVSGSNVSHQVAWLRHAVDGHAALASIARARGRDDLADWLAGLSVHYERMSRGETVVEGVRGRATRARVVDGALDYLRFLGQHPAERHARLDVWSAPLYAGGYLFFPGLAQRIALARPTAARG
ncbi:MAG TPA: glycosyltransferase family 2 protein [Thermoplasmata archaeon]|nr:glycosyltransferase family 2 protein [Thermoplasmata archaeon]